MPGIILIAGRTNAEEVARRAGARMARREWELVEVVASAPGDVALGVAGEHGAAMADAAGRLCAVDGELIGPDGPLTGAAAARAVLEAYDRDGERLDPADGSFAAALWDPARRLLLALTDTYGSRPLYLARVGAALLGAGELKGLVAAGLEPRLDLGCWAELLAYERALPGSSPLEGAERVPGGTTVLVDDTGERRVRRWRFALRPEPGEAGDLAPELGRLLARAMERRAGPGTALALSGGLDSRCMAAAGAADDALAASYGAPGSDDLVTGARVAAAAGLRHRALALAPGYLARGAPLAAWLAEGNQRCLHAHHLALRELRRDGASSLLIGLMGDDVVRQPPAPAAGPGEEAFARAVHAARARCVDDALLARVATPAFAASLRGRAAERMAGALSREEGRRPERFAQIVFGPQAPTLVDDHLMLRDPFGDRALMNFARRLPADLRRDGLLQVELLRARPELARLPNPNDGVPPSARGSRRRAIARLVRARRAAAAALRRPDRRGIGDYAADLRADPRPLEILLEPRTLARGQLREQPVRALVRETLTGRRSHARALGMLLTLELVQRQLIEGEEPAEADPQIVSSTSGTSTRPRTTSA